MQGKTYTYHYDAQIQKFSAQVMRAVSGFIVKDGVERNGEIKSERIPVSYGSPDRIVAAITSSNRKFVNHRVPMIGVFLTTIASNESVKKNPFHKESVPYRDSVGNQRTAERGVGPSLTLGYEVSIYASSTSQLMEILEQFILVFHNGITVQKSNDPHDPNFRANLRLADINTEVSYPVGAQRRVMAATLNFELGIVLSYPKNINGGAILEFEMNIDQQEPEDSLNETDPVDETEGV